MPNRCPHLDVPTAGAICPHLVDDPHGEEIHVHFTGRGKERQFLCRKCAENTSGDPPVCMFACEECLACVEACTIESTKGKPAIPERSTSLYFISVVKHIRGAQRIVAVTPFSAPRTDWLALLECGELATLEPATASLRILFQLDASFLEMSKPLTFGVSHDNCFAMLANRRGQFGRVLHLESGAVTMPLDRGNHHILAYDFALAFFSYQGKAHLLHATDWNRLDISDPRSGKLLTDRGPTSYKQDEARPEHYLDYFFARLSVSPNAEFAFNDGWAWHPCGVPRLWNLREWLTVNPWESEDGPSCRHLPLRADWDSPSCWIGDATLAFYGYGSNDNVMLPAAMIIDAATGQCVRWFPGPKGEFVFDEYLFSCDAEVGTSVWDVLTGERLLLDPNLKPTAYHPTAHHFLTLAPDSTLIVSTLSSG